MIGWGGGGGSKGKPGDKSKTNQDGKKKAIYQKISG